MKIAIIAPPWIALPPNGYGGIENVVSPLADELVNRGHEVTLYATGDSKTKANLRFFYEKALGVDMLTEKSFLYFFLNHIAWSLRDIDEDTDMIHNHCQYASFHLMDYQTIPFVNTLHGAFYKEFDKERNSTDSSVQAYGEMFDLFKQQNYTSISDAQRAGRLDLNYIATVYNGIDIPQFQFVQNPKDYLTWIGRFTPLKGLDTALSAATETNKPLKFAAQVLTQRKDEFDSTVMNQVDGKQIMYIGETTNQAMKQDLLGNAKALLFPIRWEEAFGMVLGEAMACGTPVISYARGAAVEIIRDGETGFLVNPSATDIRGDYITKKTGLEGIKEAIERLYALPEKEYLSMRKASRDHVEKKFSVMKMVSDYEDVYTKILSQT